MKLFLILITQLFAMCSLAYNDRCNLRKDSSANTRYITDLINTEESTFCQPMKIGSKRAFKVSSKKSPTDIQHYYHLKRKSEKDYELLFNFKMIEGSKTDLDEDSTWNKAYSYVWKKKANKCLSQTDGKIRGPQGEFLKIRVEESTSKNQAPIKKIDLVDEGRANSSMWTKKIDCATILHELLHLAGLVDEYKEEHTGFKIDSQSGTYTYVEKDAEKPMFDCRKVYNKSVMANHQEIWTEATATWKQKTGFCECVNVELCEKFKQERQALYKQYFDENFQAKVPVDKIPPELKKMPSSCPVGYQLNQKYNKEFPVAEENKDTPYVIGNVFPEGLSLEDLKNMISILNVEKRSDAEMKSILESRHWNAIIFPGCIAKNAEYYLNAQNAYRTSFGPHALKCIDPAIEENGKQ